MSLEGSTPSPSALAVYRRLCGIGQEARLLASNQATGVRIPDPALILSFGIWYLELRIEHSVLGRAARHGLPKSDRRVRLPQGALGNRLTGRLPDFESGGGGSNPPSRIDDSGAVAAGSDATL